MKNKEQIQNAFSKIFWAIRKDENYIPRPYKSIGEMWTVDTWEKDGVRVQLLDEGSTRKIISEILVCVENYNGDVSFDKGAENDLFSLSQRF